MAKDRLIDKLINLDLPAEGRIVTVHGKNTLEIVSQNFRISAEEIVERGAGPQDGWPINDIYTEFPPIKKGSYLIATRDAPDNRGDKIPEVFKIGEVKYDHGNIYFEVTKYIQRKSFT